MEDKLVTVAAFEHSYLAHLAKAKLESEDIECYLFDENTVAINWFYSYASGGIKLKVRSEDFERASQLLKLYDSREIDEPDFIDQTKCPGCSSINVIDEKYSKRIAFTSILLLGLPLLFLKKKYECGDCSHKWEK